MKKSLALLMVATMLVIGGITLSAPAQTSTPKGAKKHMVKKSDKSTTSTLQMEDKTSSTKTMKHAKKH